MGVSTEIGQHLFGPAEGWFGIDHPFGFAERGQPFGNASVPANRARSQKKASCLVRCSAASPCIKPRMRMSSIKGCSA